MNRPQLGILALFIAALSAMLLFPPYFGIDTASDGRIHGFLGYYPAWDAPTQERAHAILLEGGILPDSGSQVSDLAVRMNIIRLMLNTLGLMVLCLIGIFLLRGRSRRRGPEEIPEAGPSNVIGPADR